MSFKSTISNNLRGKEGSICSSGWGFERRLTNVTLLVTECCCNHDSWLMPMGLLKSSGQASSRL